MQEIKIKPLSANKCWKGKKFKTSVYKNYCHTVPLFLRKGVYISKGKLEIVFKFYVSTSAADWDNPIKPIQDIICKYYGINDNRIYKGTAKKIIVPKGQERTEYVIRKYREKKEISNPLRRRGYRTNF
jgi:Holliday junction resolvase RusA-like endonuclease